MARTVLFLLAISVTVYFGLFDYFKPPIQLSSDLRGPSDRHLHIAALAAVTMILMVGQRKNVINFSIMVVFAIALELLQIWHPDRVASLNDLIASLVGVAVGASFAVATNFCLRKMVSRNLGKSQQKQA